MMMRITRFHHHPLALWALAWLLVNVADLATTMICLRQGAQEASPVLAMSYAHYSLAGIVGAKVLLNLFVLVTLLWIARVGYPRVARYAFLAMCVLVGLAVMNNFILLI